jgi:hypothetical protein
MEKHEPTVWWGAIVNSMSTKPSVALRTRSYAEGEQVPGEVRGYL